MDTSVSLLPQTHSQQLQNSLPAPSSLLLSSLSFFGAHWQVLVGISLFPLVPLIPGLFLNEQATIGGITILLLTVISAIFGFISQIALLIAVASDGNPEGGISGAYRAAIRLLFPFVWIIVTGYLAIFGGLTLLIVPGLFLSLYLSLAHYILVMERKRGIMALAYSWFYIRGFWRQTLWRFLFFWLLVFLVFAGFVIFGASMFSLDVQGDTSRNSSLDFLFMIVQGGFITPLGVIYMYYIYRALYEIKTVIPPLEEQIKRLYKRVRIFVWIGVFCILILAILLVRITLFSGGEDFSGIPMIIESWIKNQRSSLVPSIIFSLFEK